MISEFAKTPKAAEAEKLKLLENADMYVRETRRLNGFLDYFVIDEVSKFEQSLEIELKKCSAQCSALRCISEADNELQKAIRNSENYDTEGLWVVSDTLNRCIVYAGVCDSFELEAIAESKLANLYYNYLHKNYRAQIYGKHALSLVDFLRPKFSEREDWYVSATEILLKIQKDTEAAVDEGKYQQNKSYLDELEEELAEIEKADRTHISNLLTHVYKKHPPKNSEHTLDLIKLKNEKFQALCHTGMQHYHPDVQDEVTYGKCWKVLCDEIHSYLSKYHDDCEDND